MDQRQLLNCLHEVGSNRFQMQDRNFQIRFYSIAYKIRCGKLAGGALFQIGIEGDGICLPIINGIGRSCGKYPNFGS